MNVDLSQAGEQFTIIPSICIDGSHPCNQATMAFTIPADLQLVSVDTKGKGAYDPVANIWHVGELPNPLGGKSCFPVHMTFELTAVDNVPFDLTATVDSTCVDDVADNDGTWTINVVGGAATGVGDVVLTIPDDSPFVLPAGSLIDYVVFVPTTTATLKIGVTDGGSEIVNLPQTNLTNKTISVGYFTAVNKTLYISGAGTLNIFYQ